MKLYFFIELTLVLGYKSCPHSTVFIDFGAENGRNMLQNSTNCTKLYVFTYKRCNFAQL